MKNNSKSKKLKKVFASTVLCSILCFSFAGCTPETDVPGPGPGPATSYLEESTVETKKGKNVWESVNGTYHTDYDTQEEQRAAASKLNVRIAEEGMVLMKNANNALPLTKKETKLSLFGYRSYNIMYGGGGSGAGVQGAYGIPVSTLVTGLSEAGFTLNPSLLGVYQGQSKEVATSALDGVKDSFSKYGDAAIITFSRGGAEGNDIARHDVSGNEDKEKHNLEMTDAEIEVVKYAKKNFKKVIVLINSSNCMELGELNDAKTDSNLGVDAIIWIGQTGNDGAKAIGRILNGSVNPSGHTVDTWERDFTKGPTYTNIGDLSQNKDAEGNRFNNNLYVNGEIAKGANNETYHSVEYREGIFMGYRYYETMSDTMNEKTAGSGDTWYKESVVYPFGYGLSYTSFEWALADDIAPEAVIKAANSTVTLKVKVTNTGKVAGKDVVQVYANPPYTAGGIEKATANLMGFAKTKLLQPGESQTVEVQFVAQDMASFDYNDANKNNFIGYELEAGDYEISVRHNSHDEAFSVKRTVESTILCKTDYFTGNEITTQFTGAEGLEQYKTTNDAIEANLISRTDLKQPKPSTKEDRTVTAAYIQGLNAGREYFSYQDSSADPWYVKTLPSAWDQVATRAEDEKCKIQINDMLGVSYTEPTIENGVVKLATDADSQKWETFMNQLTWEEMVLLVSAGDYGQNIPLPSIGKEAVFGGDGPTQYAWNTSLFFGSLGIDRYDVIGTNWVTAPVVASTWNTELAHEQGIMIGNESLFGNIGEWYGPGFNLHRSPFSGRNFEYYSEDGVLSGKIGQEVILGVSSKGVMARMKHMFLNDQETNRNTSGGVLTWCTEQAIRELYLKPFELCVKYGEATGGMTSFNRIGDAVCSTNYALLENIFRGEWNFKGTFVTDCQDYPEYRYLNLMCRTGQELPLGVTINMYKGEKIFAGRFGIGKASAVEGTWSAADKCVKVAANQADARYCELIRTGKDEVFKVKDMYDIYHNEGVIAAVAAKETVLSPTHYYAVRKSAQRILYDYINLNSAKNGMGYTSIPEITYTVKAKTAFTLQLQALLDTDAIGTNNIQIKKVKETLPAGLTVSTTGIITGTNKVAAGKYSLTVTLVLDGWVKKDVVLKITVEE